jgi:uncharacterized protein YecA (UPF0149 family)
MFKIMSEVMKDSPYSKIPFEGVKGLKPHEHYGDIKPKDLIGRNEKCPCGSCKKYKHCCGK